MDKQRHDLLRLIKRDHACTENVMYLVSEGIKTATIRAAEQDGLIVSVSRISYTLTDAGRAALSSATSTVEG
ncbi:hypothetical protein M5E06_17585 [Azospirillum sp. A1-3]|uniref:hypothetical protein n=1 Tax=Azospirillum sp. A1-3 TaxID=185874 RepID=UPI00207758BC|nr:hypothetical protein [Azospirillum sp. A1-3]MCM8735947.1 hypothetical protein [Azospirillum sp. A1-3]